MSTWVIGSGGLLGSALTDAFSEDDTALFQPASAFSWNDHKKLEAEFIAAVCDFAKRNTDTRTVCYAAGRGIMTSTVEDLQKETESLKLLLATISQEPLLQGKKLTFMFASSAGAIYAESTDETISENSLPAAQSAYGKEKLAQEKIIADWAAARPNTSLLIARLSTLYGPAQSHGKRQGLISHIARSALSRKPVEIFVPLDTMRDYLHVRDAANVIMRTLREMRDSGKGVTKIVASEEPVTIAEIIGVFRRILRTPPRISTGTRKTTARYPHRMKFRSVVMPQAEAKKTSLLLGIAEVLAAEKLALARGTKNA